MQNTAYIIRNYRSGDFDTLVQLKTEVEKLEQARSYTLLQDLYEILDCHGCYPEDNLWVAEINENIVGYVYATPELSIERVVLSYLVHPVHYGEGLMIKLLEHTIARARELGVKAVHTNIAQDNATAKKLLSKMEFRLIRCFLELRLDLSNVHLPDIDSVALSCRQLQYGEEGKLTEIQNCSFAGTWGFNPNTVEEISHFINLPNCSPEDITLFCEEDKPVGYCWARVEKSIVNDIGRIRMLGVHPNHRGRGVGRRILLAGLAYLKSKGLQIVELTVDSENEKACALYDSMGFRPWTSSLWYEKLLRSNPRS